MLQDVLHPKWTECFTQNNHCLAHRTDSDLYPDTNAAQRVTCPILNLVRHDILWMYLVSQHSGCGALSFCTFSRTSIALCCNKTNAAVKVLYACKKKIFRTHSRHKVATCIQGDGETPVHLNLPTTFRSFQRSNLPCHQ